MFSVIKNIFQLLPKREKFKFKVLIVLIFLMSIFEIIGLALILPFLMLVNNLDAITANEYIYGIYNFLNFNSKFYFLSLVGILAIVFSLLGVLLSIYTNIKLSKYSNDIGAYFSIKLMDYYSNKNIDLQERKDIRKKILTETAIISSSIILPSLMLISKFALVILLFLVLLLINYKATLIIAFIIFIIYISIFKVTNKKVKNNLEGIEKLRQEKSLLLNEILFNKKDISSKDKKIILREYFNKSYLLSKYQTFNNTISKLPRYLMMFVVFTTVIIISIYIVYNYENEINTIMHKILIFIILGLKLLPQIQNIFINYMKLKSNIKSFNNIKYILYKAIKDEK